MDTPAFISGRETTTSLGYDNIDPATGESLGTVARCGREEVDAAVHAAVEPQAEWARRMPADRARVLVELAAAIRADGDTLARMESEDTGKPISQARTDVNLCARYFEFYAHGIDSYYGVQIPLDDNTLVYTTREPYGVVGHVLAWNYPLQIMARAVAPALATGNASIAKPADETPRSAVRVAQLAIKAGLPAGLYNVVTGLGDEAGAAVAEHPGINHISFVGSTEVGRSIAHAAADHIAPTNLELGGKSAQIVFPDADLDKTAATAAKAILQNAGQTCSAGSRLLVHHDVHTELIERVAAIFTDTTIGPGHTDPDLGPLVSRKQLSRVQAFLDEVDNAQVITGGHAVDGLADGGAFFAPTLVDNVDPTSRIAREEVFGPVLAATPFTTEEEAVTLANGTDYALLGAVWTRDIGRGHRVAKLIRAGQVYVNTYGAGGGVELPFGGFGNSGYGREKGYEALDSFTETKTTVVSLA